MKSTSNRYSFFFAILILTFMGGCVTPPAPLPSTMYISPAVTYLRDGPSLDSPTLVELTGGDQVDILEVTDTGWCKVRSVRTNLYGWVPKDLLAATPPPIKPAPPVAEKPRLPAMYVAVKSLKMREEPNNRANVVKELEFTQKVEKMDENKSWIQVRDPADNKTGWVPNWTLEGFKLSKPKVLRSRRPASGTKKEAGEDQAPDAM
jgi:uncharacterized protein YgiM (DUF1202 family)